MAARSASRNGSSWAASPATAASGTPTPPGGAGGTRSGVTGEGDRAPAPGLGHHLPAVAGSGGPVSADRDQVSFVGGAGLRVLAAAARQAAAAGGSLHVVSGRYQVRRVFALT